MKTLKKHTKKQHHWAGKEANPENFFGFIYLVTNKTNGRMYIGKKQYSFTRYVQASGKKRRKKVVAPSGWENYVGSSKYLHQDIKKLGKDNFTFEIIWNCTTRGMLYWKEVEELVLRNVLLQRVEGSHLPLYYNRAIPGIRFIPTGEAL